MAQLPAEEFKQPLRLIMVKVGLRGQNFPNETEKNILLAHILKYYGNHTPAEIVLAFDLAITRELDLPDSEVHCYESFSCEYFSKIMDAYRRWARPEAVRYEISTAKELPVAQMTEPQMHRWRNELAIDVGKDRKNPELLPVELYDWLLQSGKINPSKAAKWRVAERAVARRQAWLVEEARTGLTREKNQLADFMTMKTWGFEGQEKKIIQDLGKRIILWEYLNNFYQIFLYQQHGKAV